MIAHDACGAPLARLSDGISIHVLPVTVFHIERWIWSCGPEVKDAAALLPLSRPTPEAPVEPGSFWAAGLRPAEAAAFAEWLGGRLPTIREWREAQASVWGSLELRPDAGADDRVRRLMDGLRRFDGRPRSMVVDREFGEMATEVIGGPAVHLMRAVGEESLLPADTNKAVGLPNAGFCCVFDERRMGVPHS